MKLRPWKLKISVALFIYFTFILVYMYLSINYPDPKDSILDSDEDSLLNENNDDIQLPLRNSSDLHLIISKLSNEIRIRNHRKFGKILPETVVIVVQVHKRAYYLKELIDSLKQAEGISKSLLIFSHDYYDDEINSLIHEITFCRVLQIFYPYSIQLNSDRFPGQDQNDCPRDITMEKALEINCNNARHPDSYGHYREAAITQTKHHWWWKINQVMDHLEVTKNIQGMFLFLEEDYYVAKDVLHMLSLMHDYANNHCPKCNMITLGNYARINIPQNSANAAEYSPWVSSKHNMGMAFSRQMWQKIRSCAKEFCHFDDYNWDWTLQHISATYLPPNEKLTVLVLRFARVFHIGECGIHHKGKDCTHSSVINDIKNTLSIADRQLFPTYLRAFESIGVKRHRDPKANGGWGDIRDHNHCMSFIKIKEEIS